MIWYSLFAAQMLVPMLNAQGIRRIQTTYSGLRRQVVANCTNSCAFCAAAYKIEWVTRLFDTQSVQRVTLMEIVNTEDGSTSTTTMTVGLGSFDIEQLSSSLALASAGVHTSSVTDLGITIAYPTAYVVVQDDYLWSGTLITDQSCAISTEPVGTTKAPAPTPVPMAAFSEVAPGVTDTIGCFFDLSIVTPSDIPLATYFADGAIRSCAPDCGNLPAIFPSAPANLDPETPPALTVAFVTACQRSTKGTDEKVVECSPVAGPPQAPATTTSGGGSGGGGSSEERHTTTDAQGSTVTVAGSAPSRNGGGGRQATTDEHGSTVIVNDRGEGYLYTSTNAQGQTIVATGGATEGQTTLTNQDSSTVVIQGATLASPGSGPGGITVTEDRGSLMVVQGGETGTLSVGQGGGTLLIAGTITQTNWDPGATISGGVGGTGDAEPTVQSEATSRRLSLSLVISGSLLMATVVVFVAL